MLETVANHLESSKYAQKEDCTVYGRLMKSPPFLVDKIPLLLSVLRHKLQLKQGVFRSFPKLVISFVGFYD